MPCFSPSFVPVNKKSVYSGLRLRYSLEVPCGHCRGCRAEQARQWTVRMVHEAQMHECNWFLTLTYNEEELPSNGSLNPKDFQSFVKDLRRDYPTGSVSYYGCGEYGGKTQRPHYHAMFFGPNFLDRYRDANTSRPGVWRSEALDSYWGKGFAELGTMTLASAAYCAGYLKKNVFGSEPMINRSTGELLEPEFSRMSLKPAIGKRWLEKYWDDVYPRDFVVMDGVEAKPPRYYDKWMDENIPSLMEEVRQARYDEAIELTKYQLNAKDRKAISTDDLYNRRDTL